MGFVREDVTEEGTLSALKMSFGANVNVGEF
jgi:hypothetical protein